MPKVKTSKQEIENLLKQQQKKKDQRTELVYKQLGQITIALPR